MPSKKPKQPKRQSHLKAKEVSPRVPQADLVKSAQAMVAAQQTSSVGPQLQPEAGDIKTKLDALGTANTAENKAAAALATAHGVTLGAEDNLAESMNTYGRKAIKVCNDDPELLKTTAVTSLPTTRSPKDTGPADVVTDVTVAPGDASQTARVKWKRPKGAGAFILQYQIEPSAPPPAGSPAPDWLPAEGLHTKNIEWTLTGLPPAATVRVRVRAIGAQVGPWSDEVLGKAR